MSTQTMGIIVTSAFATATAMAGHRDQLHGCLSMSWASIRIDPHLGDLEWVEGSYPTPLGVIKVRHEKKADGSIDSEVDIPKGIKLIK